MTLTEFMVALAILGLASAFAFSELGPWIGQSRTAAREAKFQRDALAAEVALAELAAGAVDPQARRFAPHEVDFSRVLAPRLSPAPVSAQLEIVRESERSRLVFHAPELQLASTLLETDAPLRFAGESEALVVEIERGGRWTPLLSAPFAADAPLTCVFDPIPRRCR